MLRLTVGALMARTGERQRDLAQAIGLTQTQISRKQSGQVAWSLADCDRLSAHWGIAVPDLLSGPTHAAALLPEDRLARGRQAPQTPLPTTAPLRATAPRRAVPPTATVPGPTPEPAAVVAAEPEREPGPESEPTPPSQAVSPQWFEADRDPVTGRAVQGEPAACVLCGRPTPYRGAGRPQHLGGLCPPAPADSARPAADAVSTGVPTASAEAEAEAEPVPPTSVIAPAAPPAAPPAEPPAAPPAGQPPTPAQPAPEPAPSIPSGAASPTPEAVPGEPAQAAPAQAETTAPPRRSSGGVNGPEALHARIRDSVAAALAEHHGDLDAATAALVKRAIPDVMTLFAASRVGGRYEHSDFPPLPDFLRKKSQKGADEIWEGRPKWRNVAFAAQVKASGTPVAVAALDMNAAFLSAMKTYLPLGRLEPDTSGLHHRKRSGIHRITPPAWDHADLPNPLGARHEPGPLLVTEPTLRLFLEAADLGLCEMPTIHQSWTSGTLEGLLEKLRRALVAARKEAIETGDDVTLEYVKSMYSKFVSTIGESSANREIRRPDWVHIIRSQAFANLWRKAYKAHAAGIVVVEMSGTDELHVAGDWQDVFSEGRNPDQVKLKHAYAIGGDR
jgi:hypothetical protein